MAINPHTGTTIAAGSNTGEVNVYDTEQDGMPIAVDVGVDRLRVPLITVASPPTLSLDYQKNNRKLDVCEAFLGPRLCTMR